MNGAATVRVERGRPDAHELAAVVTAVLGLARRAAAVVPRSRPAWADPATALGVAPRRGPGAWRRPPFT